jgi:hypothetical protein
MGRKSNNALVAELEEKGIQAIAIGDAKNVREIHGTLAEAIRSAKEI